jgi:hypothetical protein
MDQEFITITEAARLTGQSDIAIMRVIKDCLQQPGVQSADILRKEPRDNDFIYLVNKEVLLRELGKTNAPTGDLPKEEIPSKGERETRETVNPEQDFLGAKNEMIAMLQKVVGTQDRQIEDLSQKIDQLIERDRETNILLKTLHDKLFLLEQGRPASSAGGPNKK